MPHGTTSVSGPTAALGTHIELDLALGHLLKSRIRTLVSANEISRQAAPADIHDALETIADDQTVSPPVRQLASDLAGLIEDTIRRHPAASRITITLERAGDPCS